MNQGMVASVIGKFTNTSAHTSYLFLVKEQSSTVAFRNRSCTTKLTRLNPSRFAAPEDPFSEPPPGAGRARHYILTAEIPSTFNR